MTRKWTQVNASFRLAFNLRFVWPPTCVDLRWHWSSSNSYPGRRKFFTVWPPNAKSTQVDHTSTIYVWNLRPLQFAWTCKPTCESVWPPIASSGFANLRRDLHRLASPFGQGILKRSVCFIDFSMNIYLSSRVNCVLLDCFPRLNHLWLLASFHQRFNVSRDVVRIRGRCVSTEWLPGVVNQHFLKVPRDVIDFYWRPIDVMFLVYYVVRNRTSFLRKEKYICSNQY